MQLQIHWFDVCVLRTSIDSWWFGKKDEEMQKENLIADKLRGNGILELTAEPKPVPREWPKCSSISGSSVCGFKYFNETRVQRLT